MASHYIILGGGRRISLPRYIAAWKACRSLAPDIYIGPGVDGWGQTAAEALRDLRRGLDDRINRHDPAYGVGRKWSPDWQRHMMQAAIALNTPRLVIYWLPAELRGRFSHRLPEAA